MEFQFSLESVHYQILIGKQTLEISQKRLRDRTGDQKGGGVEWEPQIRSENRREKKNPDSNTTPLLLKCANTTQHGQAASARNTIGVSQNSCGSKTRKHTQLV